MYRILSWLLQYPDERVMDQLAAVCEELARVARVAQAAPSGAGSVGAQGEVRQFLAWMEDQPPENLRVLYSDTFDFTSETSLHLTYHLWGDLRERGQVLAALKTYYREAGLILESTELPDYLPLMLEFAAEVPDHGESLLQAFRAPIEVLRRRLSEAGNPYRLLLSALAQWLPAPGPGVEEEVQKILSGQPPQETSGLDQAGGFVRDPGSRKGA